MGHTAELPERHFSTRTENEQFLFHFDGFSLAAAAGGTKPRLQGVSSSSSKMKVHEISFPSWFGAAKHADYRSWKVLVIVPAGDTQWGPAHPEKTYSNTEDDEITLAPLLVNRIT